MRAREGMNPRFREESAPTSAGNRRARARGKPLTRKEERIGGGENKRREGELCSPLVMPPCRRVVAAASSRR